MALYLISYDINEKNKEEYQELWRKLAEMQAVKILYSEYIVPGSGGTAQDVYKELSPLIRSADRLLVTEIVNNAAWDRLLISDEQFVAYVRSCSRR